MSSRLKGQAVLRTHSLAMGAGEAGYSVGKCWRLDLITPLKRKGDIVVRNLDVMQFASWFPTKGGVGRHWRRACYIALRELPAK